MKYLKPFDFKLWKNSNGLKSQLRPQYGRDINDLLYATEPVAEKFFMGGVWIALLSSLCLCLSKFFDNGMINSSISLSSFFFYGSMLVVTIVAMLVVTHVSFCPSWFSKIYRKVFHRHTDFDAVTHAITHEQWDSPVLHKLFDDPARFAIASHEELATRHARYAQFPDKHPCIKVWNKWLQRHNPIRQEDLMALDHLEALVESEASALVESEASALALRSSEDKQKEFRAQLAAPLSPDETVAIDIESSKDELVNVSHSLHALSSKDAF